jgi:hypothetical protein
MAERQLPITPHHIAYGKLRRVKDAFKFIRDRAREGSASLERTKARFVAITYGVPVETVKRIKARFRNELSFSSEGK